MKLSESNSQLFGRIADLLNESRKFVVKSLNQTIVLTYFEVGRLIVEDEQQGKERAEYGKFVLKELSQRLTDEFGKGYSVYNLERMRNFYLVFKNRISKMEKSASLMRKSDDEKSASPMLKFESHFTLSWTHYLLLLKIDNEDERDFYEIESANNKLVS